MHSQINAVLLLDNRQTVEQLLHFTREQQPEPALQSLVEGISANSLWAAMQPAVLVGRVRPFPLLAAFGPFSAAQQQRLYDLTGLLQRALPEFRYVDYVSAERFTRRLAVRIHEYLGPDGVSRAHFTALPRGGLIVLGMLSYMLGLRAEQIVAAGDAGTAAAETLVVVDDCALSGLRFRDLLHSCAALRVVFCPLFAHSDLCRAITHAEERVVACVHAQDLQDVAPELLGQSYRCWHFRRSRLPGAHPYWVGITEYIGFAWGEPQNRYWNTDTARFETGWNVLPPRLCLKHREPVGRQAGTVSPGNDGRGVVLQPVSPGPLCPADRVLWTEMDSAIAVARMPDGGSHSAPCFRLDGSAAAMWQAVIKHGSIEAAANDLIQRYDAELHTLRADLANFVKELENNGILSTQR